MSAGRILVTCTGCGETWSAPPGLIGALCGSGRVRPATELEAEASPLEAGSDDGPCAHERKTPHRAWDTGAWRWTCETCFEDLPNLPPSPGEDLS